MSVSATSHGEAQIRMLRVVRRGDRHDPRDLTVAVRFETELDTPAMPGEVVRNLVHATARQAADGEIETFGLALCERLFTGHAGIRRVRAEISEQPWSRLETGGKAQGQAFLAGSRERRTAAITSNGQQVAVVSGIEGLTVMRTSGFAPSRAASADPGGRDDGLQRLLVATLSARWTVTSADVTFRPYRQGLRAAVLETFGCHARGSVQQTLQALADVVLASFEEIVEISLSAHERPYRPADLFTAGIENPDDLFVVIDEPVGVVEITVERSNRP